MWILMVRVPPPLIAVALVGLVLVGGVIWRVSGRETGDIYSGVVVSDNVYMAAPAAGTVVSVGVERGQMVREGTVLFALAPTVVDAHVAGAKAQIAGAAAQRAALQAELASARAALAKARDNRRRLEAAAGLVSDTVAPLDLVAARAAEDQAVQAVKALTLRIEAQEAGVSGSVAGLDEAAYRAGELAPVAPVDAQVEDVMYQPGEWAPANAVVVSLTPRDAVKLRFYVPERMVPRFPLGARVGVQCDGCASGLKATVVYVAPRLEYTPPVIYSRFMRDKLVVMLEARPDDAAAFRPGLPVDVTPLGGGSRGVRH